MDEEHTIKNEVADACRNDFRTCVAEWLYHRKTDAGYWVWEMKVCKKRYHVYMLQCADQSLYTGYTIDLRHRMDQHRRGKGSVYVRSHMPFQLVYQETFQTRQAAMQREAEIKQWPRECKLALLEPVKRV